MANVVITTPVFNLIQISANNQRANLGNLWDNLFLKKGALMYQPFQNDGVSITVTINSVVYRFCATPDSGSDPAAVPIDSIAGVTLTNVTDLLAGVRTLAATAANSSVYYNENLVATAIQIKGSPGMVTGWNIINTGSVPVYVKFFDGAPSLGTTQPVATLLVNPGPGSIVEPITDDGKIPIFATSIYIAATTAYAKSDTTAPTASTVFAEVFFL